ncbi:hypothetical protein EZJ43_10165 [Pedobacter changchengzhani]|uniref:TonB C-terminal domain-containing protein n=1 Tax=Pedobacter changchengzhani TaxID=2529274 RepID=A0A4R5MLQ8_9SPHI|nr:hypothetical protein [Pedobacter changchengzhani]TDG36039.1 hypothetical protein EZJ43_10165 [Pedobacter changchengzhani]
MKKHYLLVALLLACLCTSAQKRQNVYYIKDDVITKDKANADYRRVIAEPDSGSILFNLSEFYMNDNQKTIGQLSRYEPTLVYEGIVKKFDEQGVLTEEVNYVGGRPNGEDRTFYRNGKIKSVSIISYDLKKNFSSKIISYFDSLGNQTVKDGTGYFKEETKEKLEEGNYVNSVQDGLWKGRFDKGTYEEVFKDGKFISGISTSNDGKTHKYKTEGAPPTYAGGRDLFYELLRQIRFADDFVIPKESKKLYLQFVVDTDGAIKEIIFPDNVDNVIKKEIVRVFNKSGYWHPGIQHGIAVKVKFGISITLAE